MGLWVHEKNSAVSTEYVASRVCWKNAYNIHFKVQYVQIENNYFNDKTISNTEKKSIRLPWWALTDFQKHKKIVLSPNL